MALVRKLETGNKVETPKSKTFKLSKPGYESDFEYDQGKLQNSTYLELAKEYNITDANIAKYYQLLVEAAASGNLQVMADGTINVTGDYANTLTNQHKSLDELKGNENYTDADGNLRRGVNESNMNDIDARSHGIFTSKGTKNFREDQKAKAIAGTLFLKGLEKSVYTPEPEKAKDAYNGAAYFAELLSGLLGGNPDGITDYDESGKRKLMLNIIKTAAANAGEYYDAHDWSKIPGMTKELWIKNLADAQAALESEDLSDDSPAWAKLGFGSYNSIINRNKPKPKEFSEADFLNYTEDEYAANYVKAHAHPNATAEDLTKLDNLARLLHRRNVGQYRDGLDSQVRAAEQGILDDEFNLWFEDLNKFDLPLQVSKFDDIYPIAYSDHDMVVDPLNANKLISKKLRLQNLGFKDNAETGVVNLGSNYIETSKVLRLNTLFDTEMTVDRYRQLVNSSDPNDAAIFKNTANLIHWFLARKGKSYEVNAMFNNIPITQLPDGKIVFTGKNNSNLKLSGGEGKSGYYLQFDPQTNSFSFIKESDINSESFRKIMRSRWDENKKKQAESHKQGGVVKFLPGGSIANIYDDAPVDGSVLAYANDDIALENTLNLRKKLYEAEINAPGKNRKVGYGIVADTLETPLGEIEYELSTLDKVRLTSVLGDLGAIVAATFGGPAGSAVGAGVGLLSTSANIYADIKDGYSTSDIVKNAALGYGMDILGALPIFGIGAKGTKIAKVLRPLYKVMHGWATINAVQALPSLKKMVTSPSDMTVNDWREVASVVGSLAGHATAAMGNKRLRTGQQPVASDMRNPNAARYPGTTVEGRLAYFTRVGADGKELYLTPEALREINSAKDIAGLREALANAKNVRTGDRYGEEVAKAALKDMGEKSWYLRHAPNSLSRTPGAYFTWEELSLNPKNFGARFRENASYYNENGLMEWFRPTGAKPITGRDFASRKKAAEETEETATKKTSELETKPETTEEAVAKAASESAAETTKPVDEAAKKAVETKEVVEDAAAKGAATKEEVAAATAEAEKAVALAATIEAETKAKTTEALLQEAAAEATVSEQVKQTTAPIATETTAPNKTAASGTVREYKVKNLQTWLREQRSKNTDVPKVTNAEVDAYLKKNNITPTAKNKDKAKEYLKKSKLDMRQMFMAPNKVSDLEIAQHLAALGKKATNENIAAARSYIEGHGIFADIKRSGGRLVVKAEPGTKLPQWFTNLYGKDITDVPTDFIGNYDKRASNTIANAFINNNYHKTYDQLARYDRNLKYTNAGNYAKRNQDLTSALGSYEIDPSTENFGKALEDAYNNDINSILTYLGLDRKYGTTDAQINNKLYLKLFGSASEELGYDPKLESIYGTHSYLRIGDAYEKEYSKDLADADFLNRTFEYKGKDGKTYYFGKKANGLIMLLDDDLTNRYKSLKGIAAEPKETPKETPAAPTEKKTTTSATSGNIETDSELLKKTTEDNKPKMIRPDKLLELSRFANTLMTNRLAFNELLKYNPLLPLSYHNNAIVHGDMHALMQGQQSKAQLLSQANLPLSNSAEAMLGARAQATLNGNLIDLQQKGVDQAMLYKTIDLALAVQNENTARDNQIANQATSIISDNNKERAHLKANYRESTGDAINNLLAGLEQEYLNIHDRRQLIGSEIDKELAYNSQKQAYAKFLYDHDEKAYKNRMKEISNDLKKALLERLGSYNGVWLAPRIEYAARGSKLNYHHRNLLQSAKDFNKAMQQNKKYLYEVTTLNHKNRKK